LEFKTGQHSVYGTHSVWESLVFTVLILQYMKTCKKYNYEKPHMYLLSSTFTTTSIKICLACQETEDGVQKLKLQILITRMYMTKEVH